MLLILVVYLGAMFTVAQVQVNAPPTQGRIQIWIISNGVHTDLVLPIQNKLMDWNQFLAIKDSAWRQSQFNFVAIGWGDRGFYLETPTWRDLKFSTAFKAAFFLGKSAMHITGLFQAPQVSLRRSVFISEQQYEHLLHYIKGDFVYEGAHPKQIKAKGYGRYDQFFEAKGTYSLFYTCNTWTNAALKKAGLPACLWTIYDKAILEKYP